MLDRSMRSTAAVVGIARGRRLAAGSGRVGIATRTVSALRSGSRSDAAMHGAINAMSRLA